MHNPHLHFHVSALFPRRVSKSLKELFGSVAILGFAMSAATLFEPIFLWNLGYSLREIVFFYGIVYVLYFVLLPLGGKFTAHFGYERSLLLGSLLLIVYYLLVFGIGSFPALFFVAPIILAFQKIFYWVGFHTDFALASTGSEQGREIGEANLVVTIVSIVGPIVGGVIIARSGFSALFLIVAVLVLLSNIPLFRAPDRLPKGMFRYGDAFRLLAARSERRRFATYMGFGEEHVMLVIWPIFLFVMLGGVLGVGVIVTIAAFFASLSLLYIGKILDLSGAKRMHRWGVIGLVLTWLLRLGAKSNWQLFAVDAGYRLATGATQFPILMDRYESAREQHVVGSVVFFEQVLALSKVLLTFVLLVALPFLGPSPWQSIFFLAALMSVLYGFLPQQARAK